MTNLTAQSERPRSRFDLTWTATAAVGAVFVVAGAIQLVGSWPAVGDFAVAELIVRHFWRHIPLSGPYSAQRGYNHPLPAIYWLMWPAYVLTGGKSASQAATAVWFNGAMAALTVWLLAKRRAAMLAFFALAALPLAAGQSTRNIFVLPWNPNLGIVPLITLVFVAWRIALGESRLLPLGAGLAVWCTGVHLGFLPPSAFLGGTATLILAGRIVRSEGWRATRKLLRPALLAVLVVALFAAPPAVDLLRNKRNSNPWNVTHAENPQGLAVPAIEARRVLQAELSIPPAWAQRAMPYTRIMIVPKLQVPWVLGPVVLAVALALRRHAYDEVGGIALALATVVVASAELIHIADRMLQPWYMFPAHAASIALFAFVAWSLVRSVGSALTWRPSPRVTGIAAPTAFALCAVLLMPSLRTPYHHEQIYATAAALRDEVETHVPKGSRLIVGGPIRGDGFYTAALVLALDKDGYDVRVPDDEAWLYTATMTSKPPGWSTEATTLYVTISEAPSKPPEPGAERIAAQHAQSRISPLRWITVWRLPS